MGWVSFWGEGGWCWEGLEGVSQLVTAWSAEYSPSLALSRSFGWPHRSSITWPKNTFNHKWKLWDNIIKEAPFYLPPLSCFALLLFLQFFSCLLSKQELREQNVIFLLCTLHIPIPIINHSYGWRGWPGLPWVSSSSLESWNPSCSSSLPPEPPASPEPNHQDHEVGGKNI